MPGPTSKTKVVSKVEHLPTVLADLGLWNIQLQLRDEQQTQRMAKAWLEMEKSLAQDMIELAKEVEKAKLAGSAVTEQLIARQQHYASLRSQMEDQILRYTKGPATADIEAEQVTFGKYGIDSASAAIELIRGTQYATSFDRLPVDAIRDMVGFLGDGTPLNRLLKEAYPTALDGVNKALIEGMARGLNPVQTAREMAKGMGIGLERIKLIARTEQLRAFRTSTHRQYLKSGVVTNQKRLASRNACMACLMSDGEVLSMALPLTDHPRGRCTSVPVVRGAPEVKWETGRQWFEKQPESVQRERMGNTAYEAWKAGKFKLSDYRHEVENTTWGNHIQTKSLKDLLGISKSAPMITTVPKAIPPTPARERNLNFDRHITSKEVIKWKDRGRQILQDNGMSGLGDAREFLEKKESLVHRLGTRDEQSAFFDYIGSDYDPINQFLRKLSKSISDRLQKAIKSLDSLIGKMAPSTKDLVTIRGMRRGGAKFFENMKVGSVFSDDGFNSSSMSIDTAAGFGNAMFMEIFIPKGTQMLGVEQLSEFEIILPRGTKFIVKGVGATQFGKDLVPTIFVEVLP